MNTSSTGGEGFLKILKLVSTLGHMFINFELLRCMHDRLLGLCLVRIGYSYMVKVYKSSGACGLILLI